MKYFSHLSAPDHRMCVAAAVIGSAVVGVASSSMQADAAQGAAATQSAAAQAASQNSLEATRETNQLQWNMYQQNNATNSPYLQAGQSALAALQNGMGLGQTRATGNGTPNPSAPNIGAIGGGAGGSGAGSVLGAGASSGAAGGGQTFTNAQGQTVDANGNPVSSSMPITNYGATQGELNSAAGSVAPGQFQQTFTPSDLNLDPSYQFRLQQGELNLQSSAAARGGLLTGQGAKNINDYAGQSASQEYQAAYDRFMNNQNTQYNRLADLAGVGQTATQSDVNSGTSAANNITQNTMSGVNASNNYLTGAAAANAAGQVGSANAIAGGLNNASNNWMNWQMLSNSPYYKGSGGMGNSGQSGVVAGGGGINLNGVTKP